MKGTLTSEKMSSVTHDPPDIEVLPSCCSLTLFIQLFSMKIEFTLTESQSKKSCYIGSKHRNENTEKTLETE